MDDILVTSNKGEDRATNLLDELGNVFDIKKLGRAKHVLGLGIHQQADGVFLEQKAYTKSILQEAEFLDAKVRNTPWDNHLTENNEKLHPDEVATFRRTLGQLAYLANGTRPDIAWAVSRLASNISAPTKGGWDRAKRVLRYLNGTRGFGLQYKPCHDPLTVETYVDSSFATDKNKGKSITGYITHINGGPILWKSHLQSTVADSPNASEYIALYESAVASVSLRNLLSEIGVTLNGTCLIHEDNDGSRRLAMSGLGQKKARHLSTKHHYVQELCRNHEVKVARIASGEQPADLLTKGSHTGKMYSYLRDKLGIVNHTYDA